MRSLLMLLRRLRGFGCQPRPALPAGSVKTLDTAGARLAQLSGRPLRPYATRDFGRDQNPEGRSVVVSHPEALRLVEQLKHELAPELIVFIGCTRSLASPPDAGSEVVVASGDSQFDMLRVAASDAINCDMETEDLVRRLQAYDQAYGIDIFHAETDVVEFTLKSMPTDMSAFCQDVYEFCPDIVDQGCGTVEALQAEITKTGRVHLWWD